MTIPRGKLIALIIIILVVILGFLGYKGYQYLFGGLSLQDKEEITEEVGEITQDIMDGIHAESDIPDAEPPSDSEGENDNDTPSAPPQNPDDQEQPTVPDPEKMIEIKATYQAGLLTLQEEANSMVDRLIEGVKADYAALKASGAGKTDFLELAVVYMQKANAMETEIDAAFALILSNMKAELETAGMAEEEIKVYADQLETEYENQKSARSKAIMNKAQEYL